MGMEITWKHFSAADILSSIKVIENRFMPRDELWMVNRLGDVHKIINIGNALSDNAAISLCVGEMK